MKQFLLLLYTCCIVTSSFAQNPHIDQETGKYKFYLHSTRFYVSGSKGIIDSITGTPFDIMLTYDRQLRGYRGKVLKQIATDLGWEFLSIENIDRVPKYSDGFYDFYGKFKTQDGIYQPAKITLSIGKKNLVAISITGGPQQGVSLMFMDCVDNSELFSISER